MARPAFVRTVLAALPLAALAAVLAAAQVQDVPYAQYEDRYGKPIDVSITDLVQNPDAYHERAVRTRGSLEIAGLRDAWLLRDTFGNRVRIAPVNEVAPNFEQAARGMMGQEVEITGLVQALGTSEAQQVNPSVARVGIMFWSYQGPPEKVSPDALKKAAPVSLETLVTTPGRRDGQMVRVVGKFRGHNLYGDLPSRSQRERGDWVIKDEAFAVWVSGKKPKGKGFDLDASLKRDTGKWMEVIGKPVTRGGVTYIQAAQVTLSGPPTPTADALPPSPPPERPKVSPVIVFALPLDGDGAVSPDSRFVVQFNKDMDESTFQNHVVLRYAGPVRPGDQPLNSVKLSYDRGRKALTVDPGMMLAAGRQLELVLLPGIVDVEGLALMPRASPTADGITDVLRFSVGT